MQILEAVRRALCGACHHSDAVIASESMLSSRLARDTLTAYGPPNIFELMSGYSQESALTKVHDSTQAAFKHAVEDWRGLPEEDRRKFTQQALELQSHVAQAGAGPSGVQDIPDAASDEEEPSGSLEQGPELAAQDPAPAQRVQPIRPEPMRHPAMQRPHP